jgi:hypothetical protein
MGHSNNPKNEAIMSRLKCEVRKLKCGYRTKVLWWWCVLLICKRTTHYRPAPGGKCGNSFRTNGRR